MKIALIGEFSGLHTHLKSGLEALGHEARVYAAGDGFKSIPYDSRWGPSRTGYQALMYYLFVTQPLQLRRLGYTMDVIQFINPYAIVIPNRGGAAYVRVIGRMMQRTKAVKSLVVAGCDYFVEKYNRHNLSALCASCLRFDQKSSTCLFRSRQKRIAAEVIADVSDLIVPFSCPAYARSYAYAELKNREPLMLPINTARIPYAQNLPGSKIRLLHGINRPGFKGTDVIVDAIQRVCTLRPDRFEAVVSDRVPYSEYIATLCSANVVLDQLYSDGFGMNALLALAAGRVVLTGYDPRFHNGGASYAEAPAIKIAASRDALIEQLIDLANWPVSKFEESGRAGREFVKRHCDPMKIGNALVDCWRGVQRR